MPNMRVSSLSASFLLFWLPVVSSLRQKRKDALNRQLSSLSDVVERIACVAPENEFYSLIAIEFGGSLREETNDPEVLASLLVDSFKQETSFRCDPFQRTMIEAQFNRVYSIPGVYDSVALYNIRVLSYNGAGTPASTALEQAPPVFLSSDKQSLGQACSIAQILMPTSSNCPMDGCYCPPALLSSNTTGVTEMALARAMNTNLQNYATQPKSSNSAKGKGSKSAKGSKSSKSSKASRSSKSSKGGKKPRFGVESIDSVAEVQSIEPCEASDFFTFEATMVTFMTEDPCKIGKKTLKFFLNMLVAEYNRAQFETCDFSFRRIVSYEIVDTCSKHHERNRNLLGGFTFPWRPTTSTSSETTVTTNPGRRFLGESNTTLSFSTQEESNDIHRFLGSHAGDGPLCLCSAFSDGTTDGITKEQFTALADIALQAATNGKVQVLDQFQVESTCAEDNRVCFNATGEIELVVPASSLSYQDLEDLEEVCILGYNSYIIEQCSEFFYQVRECEITVAPPCSECSNSGYYLRFTLSGTMGESIDNPGFAFRFSLGRSLQESRQLTYYPVPVLEDSCYCRDLGEGYGQNPTEDEFAEILNITGLVADVYVFSQYPGDDTR